MKSEIHSKISLHGTVQFRKGCKRKRCKQPLTYVNELLTKTKSTNKNFSRVQEYSKIENDFKIMDYCIVSLKLSKNNSSYEHSLCGEI